jgi:hypothetical protein
MNYLLILVAFVLLGCEIKVDGPEPQPTWRESCIKPEGEVTFLHPWPDTGCSVGDEDYRSFVIIYGSGQGSVQRYRQEGDCCKRYVCDFKHDYVAECPDPFEASITKDEIPGE